jgi:hypothetical protein
MTHVREHVRRRPNGGTSTVRAHYRRTNGGGGSGSTGSSWIGVKITVAMIGMGTLIMGVSGGADAFFGAKVPPRSVTVKIPKAKAKNDQSRRVPLERIRPHQLATRYDNCDALHLRYRHGVGLPGAIDQKRKPGTGGRVVTNFYRSVPVYMANSHLDADHDGIACAG